MQVRIKQKRALLSLKLQQLKLKFRAKTGKLFDFFMYFGFGLDFGLASSVNVKPQFLIDIIQ